MSERPEILTGRCLCGAVSYEVRSPFLRFAHCHCSRCRHATGTGNATNLYCSPERFKWLSGEEQLGQDGSTVDVNDCVRQALSKVEPGHAVRVEAGLQDGIPALPLYSFDIVVQNLLQNALDAMPDGGTLTVSTSAVRHAKPVTGYVQLTVGDTGVGIPPEIASKVFDLKFTTKRERNRGEGLGLGLWWVRNFVRRAKGDITIRSEPGSGTKVYVKIPIGTADGPADGPASG